MKVPKLFLCHNSARSPASIPHVNGSVHRFVGLFVVIFDSSLYSDGRPPGQCGDVPRTDILSGPVLLISAGPRSLGLHDAPPQFFRDNHRGVTCTDSNAYPGLAA